MRERTREERVKGTAGERGGEGRGNGGGERRGKEGKEGPVIGLSRS